MDPKEIEDLVEDENLDELIKIWEETESETLEDIQIRTQILHSLESNPQLEEEFVSIVGIREEPEETNDQSKLEKLLHRLQSQKGMRFFQTLTEIAKVAAETENWYVIRSLLDNFAYERAKPELARRIMYHLYYLAGQAGKENRNTEELTLYISKLFDYIDAHDLGPYRLDFQTSEYSLQSKNKDLIRMTLIDYFPLHGKGYCNNWQCIERNLKSALQAPEGTITIFLNHLKRVGSPFYAQAVEYVNREDV